MVVRVWDPHTVKLDDLHVLRGYVDEGYVHDTMAFRIRNCYLTENVRFGMYITFAILAALTSVLGFGLVTKSTKNARTLCLVSAILCLETSLYQIVGLDLNDVNLNVFDTSAHARVPSWVRLIPTLQYIAILVTITSCIFPMVIWSLLHQVYVMYNRIDDIRLLRIRLAGLSVISLVLGLGIFISLILVHENDDAFNFRLALYIILLLAISPAILLSFAFSSRKIQQEIMALSHSNSGSDSAHQQQTLTTRHPNPMTTCRNPTKSSASKSDDNLPKPNQKLRQARGIKSTPNKLLHFKYTVFIVTIFVSVGSLGGGILASAYAIPVLVWHGYPYLFICDMLTMISVIPLSLGLYTFTIRKLQFQAAEEPNRTQDKQRRSKKTTTSTTATYTWTTVTTVPTPRKEHHQRRLNLYCSL